MMLPPKICPQCGEEYVHSVTTCVQCEVALVQEGELEAGASQELPPAAELSAVRTASAGWAVALSDLLVEAGIPHRVEQISRDDAGSAGRGAAAGSYGVYVRAEDLERARAVDASHIDQQIPDLPEDWEASATAGGEGCPACGAAVADDAAECPDCGLALALHE